MYFIYKRIFWWYFSECYIRHVQRDRSVYIDLFNLWKLLCARITFVQFVYHFHKYSSRLIYREKTCQGTSGDLSRVAWNPNEGRNILLFDLSVAGHRVISHSFNFCYRSPPRQATNVIRVLMSQIWGQPHTLNRRLQVEAKENATTPVTTKQQLFSNQKYIQTNVKRTIKLGK